MVGTAHTSSARAISESSRLTTFQLYIEPWKSVQLSQLPVNVMQHVWNELPADLKSMDQASFKKAVGDHYEWIRVGPFK